MSLDKLAMTKFKAMGKGNKFLSQIAKKVTEDIIPEGNLFSKAYTKNVNELINSRALHPEIARPYANYVTLAGNPAHVVHRINHFRTLENAGW